MGVSRDGADRSIVGGFVRGCGRVAVVAGALTATLGALGVGTPPVARAATQPQPPPICSSLPPDSPDYCLHAPVVGQEFLVKSPVLADMPTALEADSDAGVLGSGAGSSVEVTFSITDFGQAADGWTLGTIGWASPAVFQSINAPVTDIRMTERDGPRSCDNTLVCTYTFNNFHPHGGWYGNRGYNGIVERRICRNDGYTCGGISSDGAFYIPETQALKPPRVKMALATAGHVMKAVAIAQDPLGSPLTLTWNFGDDTPPQVGTFGTVVTHTYTSTGDFSVTANVKAADSRYQNAGQVAHIAPPAPFLSSFERISPDLADGTVAVAAGDAPGWAAGSDVVVKWWENGCPADPTSDAAVRSSLGGIKGKVDADQKFSLSLMYLHPTANAAVVEVTSHSTIAHGSHFAVATSACVPIGQAARTTAPSAPGANELAVVSSSVPIGHIALIDADTPSAERRLVTGHGSLIFGTALTNSHPAGAVVLDLGPPIPPPPPDPAPPADPPLPTAFAAIPGVPDPNAPTPTPTPPVAGSAYSALVPARLFDTRTDPGTSTIDGQGLGAGLLAAGSVTQVQVAGRGGVPNAATAAVLNVTVTGPGGAGYVTVYPCGSDRPTSSNLNYIVGQTVPNAVITKIGTNGNVCFYTQSATHLIIDVNGAT